MTTNWEYSPSQLGKLKLLFAEQARRGDLIFGTGGRVPVGGGGRGRRGARYARR